MRQIPPHRLWLAHSVGSDYQGIFDLGIQAIVQLAAEESPLQSPRELTLCRFPLIDGPGNEPKTLDMAITTVANLIEKNVPTLVCCGAGMSRSPAITAAALSLVFQDGLDECLKQVAEHQPADVTAGFWLEIKKFLDGERYRC